MNDETEDTELAQRKKLERYRDEVRSFIGTIVHTLYIKGIERQLGEVERRIIEDEIVDVKDVFELLDFRGQRKVLIADKTLFEVTVANLDARIDEMINRENETQQKEVTDNE